jgi:hypothetical protein
MKKGGTNPDGGPVPLLLRIVVLPEHPFDGVHKAPKRLQNRLGRDNDVERGRKGRTLVKMGLNLF